MVARAICFLARATCYLVRAMTTTARAMLFSSAGTLEIAIYYGEHNLAYQEYPPKTAILAHVPSRSVCPWDVKK